MEIVRINAVYGVMASNNTGLAGEFYAMHKLFLEGYEPTLTLGNTKGIDILLYNPKNGKQFKVEVKTSRTLASLKVFRGEYGKYMQWMMSKKHESYIDKENLVYCFVFISKNKDEKPRIFFLDPQSVGMRVRWLNKTWLHGKHRNKVKDGEMRDFIISSHNLEKNKYNDNFVIFE